MVSLKEETQKMALLAIMERSSLRYQKWALRNAIFVVGGPYRDVLRTNGAICRKDVDVTVPELKNDTLMLLNFSQDSKLDEAA